MGLRCTIEKMLDSLREGRTPDVEPDGLPCFSREAMENNPMIPDDGLERVLHSLDEGDIPTLERALEAVEGGEQAWLGFKVVVDPDACEVGAEGGSADAESGIFLETRTGSIVSKVKPTERDVFQMDDITKGPSMHAGQYPGLTWMSVPLFDRIRVLVFGAGDVSQYIARYAMDCGFDVLVMDDDEGFLNAERFPEARTRLIDFGRLDEVDISERDYAVVVTRNHAHDPETLARVVECHPAYMGMMGHVEKVRRNFDQVLQGGADAAVLEEVHAPIGLECGSKTPAEVAISIVAQLIKVRREAVAEKLGLEG